MHRVMICLWTSVLIAALSHGASGQTTARIRTEQTSIEVRAEAAGPQLVTLGSWKNDAPEKLIDSVQMDGQSVKVAWKFNRQASRIEAGEIAFVYDCAS